MGMRRGSRREKVLGPGVPAHTDVAASCTAKTASRALFAQHAGIRALAIGVVALSVLSGLSAAGCSSSTFETNLPTSNPNPAIAALSLMVESVPPGAEARIRNGSSCRTPCELTVTPMGPFVVDLTLRDYEPQSVEVILAASNPADISAGIRLDPNPLIVQFTAVPRPPSKTKPAARKSATEPIGPQSAGIVSSRWPAR
jgi:PEGA domain